MKPIHIITVGSFGEEVANKMVQKDADAVVTKLEDYHYFLPTDRFPSARLHIFACDKPLSRMTKHLDIMFSNWREPWVAITQEHPYVRIGPFVNPGEGGCYHCFEARYLQNSTNAAHVRGLYDYYSMHPNVSPNGYLPGFAGIAAAYTRYLIKKLDAQDPSLSGMVFQLNMLTRSSFSSKVVSIHGCPRCGGKTDLKYRSLNTLSDGIEETLNRRKQAEVTIH